MPKGELTCRACGAALEAGSSACPACGAPVTSDGPAADGRTATAGEAAAARSASRTPENPFTTELNRRLGRLSQWSEAAEPLGVAIPRLPVWAEEAAAHSRTPEAWAEVVRGIERLAQRRISEAFNRWEERTSARIGRLEAYSVDSRLERSQVEDAVHAAKSGDVAQALATFQQVDRVVALKERHLDQARGELERLLAFLRDLEALGLVDPGEPADVAGELERELRTGHLVSLKQRLRLLRSRAVGRISESFAEYVGRIGDQLAVDRSTGVRSDADVRELAVAARAVVQGHPEDGARRLRALKEARGLTTEALSSRPGPTRALRPS
ncbi:MAG TPA: zinc ribbon domain-containing protein [Thermoplasmata archaeon]|nr:zinc ribbon domain-containing protein [Thermoplasmata archaeon]